jgi:F-type H+-transporting ATPase subunit O
MVTSYGGQSPLTEEDVEIIKAFKQNVEPEHRPPIKVRGVPASYANAAYINASRDGTLAQLEADLGNCRDLVTKESVLFVKSPAVTEERKFELLDEELQNRKIGSDATGRMLKKLIEDNKFNLLDDVIDNFGKLMRAKRGELIAIVTSADKLAKKTSAALKQGLEAQFDNKTVIIENKVDPEIIGGLMIDIDDKFADLSVRTALFDEHYRRSNSSA